ncbi:MAG: hypothetical protein ACD_39C00278G0001 [uncultured bacterium]|nr:MAG: hypothetical protein ACD_39C00278G0001 [uncultured bacterium]
MPEHINYHKPENVTGSIFLMTPRQLASLNSSDQDFSAIFLLSKPVTTSKLYNAMLEILQRPERRLYELRKSGKHRSIKPQTSYEHLGLSILVVEDNDINQEVAKGILEMLGCTVTLAGSGAIALEFLEQVKFDVVLLDCQMPEMDGFEVVRIIRSRPEHTDLPVIAMTAHSMPGDREKCLKAGMNDYLAKPIEAKLLIEALKNISGSSKTPMQTDLPESPRGTATIADRETDTDLVLDNERIKRIFGKKPQSLTNLVKAAFDNYTRLSREIEEALSRQDYATAVRNVHTIKGSLGNLGGNRAAELAARLEQALKGNDAEQAHKCKAQLEKEFTEFFTQLEKLEAEIISLNS